MNGIVGAGRCSTAPGPAAPVTGPISAGGATGSRWAPVYDPDRCCSPAGFLVTSIAPAQVTTRSVIRCLTATARQWWVASAERSRVASTPEPRVSLDVSSFASSFTMSSRSRPSSSASTEASSRDGFTRGREGRSLKLPLMLGWLGRPSSMRWFGTRRCVSTLRPRTARSRPRRRRRPSRAFRLGRSGLPIGGGPNRGRAPDPADFGLAEVAQRDRRLSG